jgi:hypothetical protein
MIVPVSKFWSPRTTARGIRGEKKSALISITVDAICAEHILIDRILYNTI